MLENKMLAWGVSEGRIASEQKPIWLLDELIEQGDQWIINGAPKSGKSLLATQLALAIASGGQFLNWKNQTPARVLYMDFELKDRLFWKRFLTMTTHNNVTDQTIERNFFRCGDFQTTDVLDPVEAKKMISIVNEIQPDLIIWDVLARMHTAAENDNSMMGQVMRSIRKISRPAAHIVVHHARKSSPGAEGYNAGAAGIRGASSIHGEADGVMSLALRDGQGARFSLRFSSRAVETPDEILLNRTEHLIFVSANDSDKNTLLTSLKKALSGHTSVSAAELVNSFRAEFSIQERQAKNYIRKCVANAWVRRERRPDKTYEYIATDLLTDVSA